MRSPIRLKNFRPRFLPYYAVGAVLLWLARPTPLVFVVGAALVVCGAALRAWGAGHLVKNDELIVTGPYARVRHPLYAGTLLVGIGFAVIVGRWLALLMLAAFLPWFFMHYMPRKERAESARLEERYGPTYRAYREEVPALIPARSSWRPSGPAAGQLKADLSWSTRRYLDNNELGTLLALALGLVAFALRISVG